MRVRQLGLAIIGAITLSAAAGAQTAPAPEKPLAYEVVSIKVHKNDSGNRMWNSTPDGIRMENVTLFILISDAYALRSATDNQVIGLPKWAEQVHFDVEAKVSDDDLEAFKKMTYRDRASLLLAALEDRFKLKAHQETRELPIYSLIVNKGGLKIKPAAEGNTYANGIKMKDKPAGPGSMTINMSGSTYHAEFQAVTMPILAANLTRQVQRQVDDDTGLTGRYDLKLDWASEDAKDSSVPGIFTALQEQLGLKLVPARGPVECVVVDHVEQPTEN